MQNPVSTNQTPAAAVAAAVAAAAASMQDYHQRHLAIQRLQQQQPSYSHPQQQQQQQPSYSHPQQQQQQQQPSYSHPQQQQQPSYSHPQQQQQHWNRPIVMHWDHPYSSLPYNTTAGLPRATLIATHPTTAAQVAATNPQHHHHHPDRSDNNRSTAVKRKWQEIGHNFIVHSTDIPPSATITTTSNTSTIPRNQNPPLARNVAATVAAAAAATSNNKNNGVHNLATGIGISNNSSSSSSSSNNNSSASNSMGSVEVSSGIPNDSLGDGLAWPEGWTKTTRKRLGGKSAGTYDSYWISPRSKFKLRSIPEVKRFLAALQMHGGDEQLARREFRKKKTTLPSQSQPQSQPPPSESVTGTATTVTISVGTECQPSLQKSPSLLPSKATSLHALQVARPSAIAQSGHMSTGAAAAAAIIIAAKIATSASATSASTSTTGIPKTAQQKDSSSRSGAHSNVPKFPLRKATSLHALQAARPSAIAQSGHMSAGAAAAATAAAITIAAKIATATSALTSTTGIPKTAQHKDSSSRSGAHSNVPKLPLRPLLRPRAANTVAFSCPPVATLAEGGGPLTVTLTVPAQRATLTSNVSSNVSSKATLAATATATTSSVISVDSSDEIEFPNDHVVL